MRIGKSQMILPEHRLFRRPESVQQIELMTDLQADGKFGHENHRSYGPEKYRSMNPDPARDSEHALNRYGDQCDVWRGAEIPYSGRCD